nr:uncharacterized protein LOC109403210 [Aedes albopictus]
MSQVRSGETILDRASSGTKHNLQNQSPTGNPVTRWRKRRTIWHSLWRVQPIRRSDTCGPRGREQTRDAILRDSYRYVGTKAFKKKAFICSLVSLHGGGISQLKRDGITVEAGTGRTWASQSEDPSD